MFFSLDTADLVIRPFRRDDSKAVFRLSQEAGMASWMPDQVYENEEEAAITVEFLISQYAEALNPHERPLVLAVEQRGSGELVGHIGLSPLSDGEVEVGFAIAEKLSGRGYATQAVSVVSGWARSRLGIPAIRGVVASENAGSARVLEKSGYQLEEEKDHHYLGKVRPCRMYRFVH